MNPRMINHPKNADKIFATSLQLFEEKLKTPLHSIQHNWTENVFLCTHLVSRMSGQSNAELILEKNHMYVNSVTKNCYEEKQKVIHTWTQECLTFLSDEFIPEKTIWMSIMSQDIYENLCKISDTIPPLKLFRRKVKERNWNLA